MSAKPLSRSVLADAQRTLKGFDWSRFPEVLFMTKAQHDGLQEMARDLGLSQAQADEELARHRGIPCAVIISTRRAP